MTAFPAITVWQPWATLIAAGAKPFEFRGWKAPRRLWGKRVAIHAGARPVRLNDSDRDEHSNWGWPLTDIERLEPFVPARGRQGWWTWTP